MQKKILTQNFMAQSSSQERKIQELQEELKALKKQMEDKDKMLQQQPPEPLLDVPLVTEHVFLDPLTIEDDQPGTSEMAQLTEDMGIQDPRETDLEVELKRQIQNEVDEVAKECMQWEKDILHSAALAYLTPKFITADYHMPTLPYPLLKQEVFMIKKQYLPQCPIDQLGGYNQIQLEDSEVSSIMENQPQWRTRVSVVEVEAKRQSFLSKCATGDQNRPDLLPH